MSKADLFIITKKRKQLKKEMAGECVMCGISKQWNECTTYSSIKINYEFTQHMTIWMKLQRTLSERRQVGHKEWFHLLKF